MDATAKRRQDRIAQWAFDTRSILGRFHLWLEEVEERWPAGGLAAAPSFVGPALERAFIVAAGVTALGTRLFGRWGEGKGLDKAGLNQVKKDADAISAYALSEAIWHLTRSLPENHAVMVCLGEGLMPKAGETPEMGANPLLGFGRVYARPEVARFLDRRVQRLINDPGYGWEGFWSEVQGAGVTVWGTAVDTLENTSRFAGGAPTGPMTVLHLYDQPLRVTAPYEGYVGTLVLPRRVVEAAQRESILLTYHTPRARVLEAIRLAYPEVPPERIRVWTLGGGSREARLGGLWRQWRELGVELVEEGAALPGGGQAFVESGTYAPVFRVGPFADEDGPGLFLCDGYAASAEAIQAASLDPVLGIESCLCLFSSRFVLPAERERRVMELDPDAESFPRELAALAGTAADDGAAAGDPAADSLAAAYRESIHAARAAGMPRGRHHLTIDDFFPRKRWRELALAGFMLPDPYSGAPGVEEVGPGTYRVTVRAATRERLGEVDLTLRLMETPAQSKLIFSPLLDRFYAGHDHTARPVKISDSGRIRNELQTLCSTGLEHLANGRMRIDFDRIGDGVLAADKKARIREVLAWYKEHHPVWFDWLEIG